jgi:hypothetical protein
MGRNGELPIDRGTKQKSYPTLTLDRMSPAASVGLPQYIRTNRRNGTCNLSKSAFATTALAGNIAPVGDARMIVARGMRVRL